MTALFLLSFALYLHTCAPHLAPYRDAGEMASLLGTMGVAHPPGYPLYTLLGRLVMWVPLGNLVYRANFFSALCASGALVILFMVFHRWMGKLPALFAVGFFAFSNPFWELASVSEMYALGVMWFALLLYATFVLENTTLFAFLMALGLGVRMDMLLLVPIFALWFLWGTPLTLTLSSHTQHGGRGNSNHEGRGEPVVPSPSTFFVGGEGRVRGVFVAAFFLAGASVFLYLLVRSRTNPLIDWGNPDTLTAVFNSATRKSYSGTLDLLSLSYQKGANFFVNLKLYGAHVVASFGWWGAALALVGVWAGFKRERKVALFLSVVFLVTGPVFLFLANMPPNPHAIAIVEASYLIPDLILAAFIGFGVKSCHPGLGRHPGHGRHPGESRGPGLKPSFNFMLKDWTPAFAGVTVGMIVLLSFNAVSAYERSSKRDNLFARDFVENVFRSIPAHAVAVFQKDVQLFSLWEAQILEGRRQDASLVSKGLSASPWYWEMKRRWKTAQAPEISLKDPGGWARMKESVGSRPLVVGYDVDWVLENGLGIEPQGLVLIVAGMDPGERLDDDAGHLLANLCLYRGHYTYGETPDFFSTDLIGDHARAHHQQGLYELAHGRLDVAEWFFKRAETLDPNFARVTSDRAYLRFSKGDFAGAYNLYRTAAEKSRHTLDLTAKYKSLPSVADGCRQDLATMLTQVGAAAERLGRLEEARGRYLSALNVQENAQAHYNLAVTYWGRDWEQVIRHMRRAVELNPEMAEARNYLAKAEMLRGNR